MIHDEIEALLLAAEEDNKHGCFANAEKLAREAIQHTEDKTSTSEALHIRALILLSESLWRRGMAKDALPLAEQALALSEDGSGLETKKLNANALHHIGTAYAMLSENAKALEYYEKSLAVDEELGNKVDKVAMARTISNIGLVCDELSQYTRALAYYEKALAIDEELDNKAGVARDTGGIGNVYCNLSEFAKALEHFEKGLALEEELGNKGGVALATSNVGLVCWHLSQYPKALEYFEKALALFELLDNKGGVALQTGNIGNVYSSLFEYPKALEYFEKALALFEELGSKAVVATITGNIGSVYNSLSQYVKALEYQEKSLKLSEAIGDRLNVGHALSHIGVTLRKMGRNKEAMEYLQRAVHLMREEIETNVGVAGTLISIGSLLAEENQFGEAIEKLEEALAIAEKSGEKNSASDAHKELATVHAKQGDKAKAFDHLLPHYSLKEAIFSDETRKQVEAFNIRMAVAEKEKEKQLAVMKAEKLLSELSTSTLQLLAQTELLSDLRADLLQIARKIPVDVPAAKELRERVKNLPCQSIDWVKFDAQFKAAHPEFVRKLLERYPQLTPMETRVCTLLRLNLKSIEIAKMFCLEERSVETHRFNIRKKLKIETKQSLSNFLNAM